MSIFFILKEGISNISRARVAAAISIVSISLSLTILTVFAITGENVKGLFENVFKQIEIEAFLMPNQSSAKISQAKTQISAYQEVRSVIFVSKEQALKEFQESFGEDFSTVVTENPLPSSLRITLKSDYTSPDVVEKMVVKIETLPAIQNCIYPEQVLKIVHEYFGLAIGITLFLVIGLIAVVTILVFNTIRLTIHSRRDIISIMRLVGATNWLVRSPFIVEGMVQGLAGGLIACLFVYLITLVAGNLFPESLLVHKEMYGVILIFGISLGWFGSVISVNKYLKN